MTTAPAGWYPDPGDDSQERYWDGTNWTENRRGSAEVAPAVGGGAAGWGTSHAPAEPNAGGWGSSSTTAGVGQRAASSDPVFARPAVNEPEGGRGPGLLALGSLVAGILGIALFWFYGIGGVLGIAAIVLAVVASRAAPGSETRRSLVTGGVVTGALAVAFSLSLLLFVYVLGNTLDDTFDDLDSGVEFDSSVDGGINSDPSDGECDFERFMQDPDC